MLSCLDIDELIHGRVGPLNPSQNFNGRLELLMELANHFINDYNEKEYNVFKYKVMKIEKVTCCEVISTYWMTVKVSNLTIGSIETFQIHAGMRWVTNDKIIFCCRPKEEVLSLVPPLFDRLILMVIDGLPAKFVLGKDDEPPPKSFKEAMPYTQSLLTKGRTIGYHAKAAPPTVTMPHLKGMVSGAVRGFLDVAFNFNKHLEVHLPGLVCENFLCNDFRDDGSERTRGYSSLEETFCCLYMKAADLHRSWKSGEEKRSACEDNCYNTLVAAYYNFLRIASSYDATLMAQIVYVVLGFYSTTIVVLVPWCLLSKIVAAVYYMGMAGHFGLVNTNTLATIDVAGAFIVRVS
ncbi:hypothetical protein KY285_009116 [Solanum tuberosum]|nr:hypothetical protein KY285_009116 [Solanum tuberosum]